MLQLYSYELTSGIRTVSVDAGRGAVSLCACLVTAVFFLAITFGRFVHHLCWLKLSNHLAVLDLEQQTWVTPGACHHARFLSMKVFLQMPRRE